MKGFFRVAFIVCTMAFFSACRCWADAASSSRLEIADDKLYIAGIGHGFHVLDISNPVRPKWIGGWNNHTCPVGVQVVDGVAYLANRTSGFEVIDVSNPATPAPIGHLRTGGDLQTVQVVGHYAYVADRNRGFDVIDVSDPKQPKLAGDFQTKGQGWSVVVVGGFAYAGFGGGVLRTFQLENDSQPKLTNECQFAGGNAAQIVDGILFVGGYNGLCAVDIHNPANPKIISHSAARMNCESLFIRGNLAFATGPGIGMSVFDASNPANLRQLGVLEVGYQGFGVQVRGNFAYVVDGGSNLHVYDVSNPTKPIEVNRVGTENFCSQVLSLTSDPTGKSSNTIPDSLSAITNAPPQLTNAVRLSNGTFSFSLHGVPGGIYDIQASTDLIHWTVISTSMLPETGVLTIFDPDAHQFKNRFYRAIKQP